jgi:hypothetical protein
MFNILSECILTYPVNVLELFESLHHFAQGGKAVLTRGVALSFYHRGKSK